MTPYRRFLWWAPVALLLLACNLSSAAVTSQAPKFAAQSHTPSPTGEIIGTSAAPTPVRMVVCSDGLNVRAQPDVSARAVDILPRGSVVQVLSWSGSWASVGVGRWVRGVYLCQ